MYKLNYKMFFHKVEILTEISQKSMFTFCVFLNKKLEITFFFFLPNVTLCIWRRKWQPTPVFLPRESHGRRSLVGYSPRGCQSGSEHLYA